MRLVVLFTLLFWFSHAYQQPNEIAARFNRAVELQRKGELKEAAAEYRALLAVEPNYAEAQANLGAVLARLGDYQEAIAAYESALRLNPRLTPILLNLGIAHYRAGQFAKAVEALERFLGAAPDHLQARQLIGNSLVELGRDAEAISYLEPTLQIAPNEVTALYSLGAAYLRLRRIKASVVRWPGGCFADSYDWRDGIGPRKDRPRRTNFWRDSRGNRTTQAYERLNTGPQKYEPNWFGTNEFMRFCKLTGMQPYVAANLRSLPAKDFYEWVEYCNAPAGETTLSDLRAAAGDRDPFNVQFWGIGNESWGCGGRFTPEEYSQEFRRFIAFAPRYGLDLKFIGAGPNGGDISWTRRFFNNMAEKGANQLSSMCRAP